MLTLVLNSMLDVLCVCLKCDNHIKVMNFNFCIHIECWVTAEKSSWLGDAEHRECFGRHVEHWISRLNTFWMFAFFSWIFRWNHCTPQTINHFVLFALICVQVYGWFSYSIFSVLIWNDDDDGYDEWTDVVGRINMNDNH